MKLSYSRVSTFTKCPYQFKLRYIDKLKTLPKGDPQDPLILGTALHKGIETDIQTAIKEYYNSYPIITDSHITEAIKLEYWLPKIKEVLPEGLHEVKIESDEFIGYIDLLVPVDENTFDLYDFKYSNNIDSYLESEQLHLYKYYFEKLNPSKKIRDMYFMFVPKCNLKLKYKNKTNKRDETLREFRQRIKNDLDNKKLEFVKVEYDDDKVFNFYTDVRQLVDCKDYKKTPSRLCDWCDYQKLCEKGDDIDMVLPSTNRREIENNDYKKIWIYGLPFVGKTYLANQFDTPLMLNTDGNYKQVDAPVIRIIDEVKTEGRITKRKYAWDVFKDTIDELEKGSDFKTIIVDLLEDVYDTCRIKVCVDNGWDHESDDSFKAYDIVRSEFLRTMKRLLNLDYNIVLISHEDTSRDITKKTGDKVTAIKPNLQEKVALKIAGMVDMVIRVINDEGKRVISFKSNEVEFGGGRLNIQAKTIPCNYEELMKVYGGENNVTKSNKRTDRKKTEQSVQQPTESVETAIAEPTETETPERKTRTRKPREVLEEAKTEEVAETPVRRRRKRESE